MRQLVRQDALELAGRLFERAAHRNADATAVIRACGPRGRARRIAELLLRVEHHGDHVIGERVERGADAPVGGLEQLHRTPREIFVRGTFEQYREVRARRLEETFLG